MKTLLGFCVIGVLSLATPTRAFSQTEIEYSVKGKLMRAMILCDGEIPTTVRSRVPQNWIEVSKLVNSAKKRVRLKKNTRSKKQLQNFRALLAASIEFCGHTSEDSPHNPPDKHAENPTPSPSPQKKELFERNGEVTPFGKAYFGIPDTLNANAIEGYTVYQNTCQGCHGEQTKDSFLELRLAISASPMFFTEQLVSDESLADLVAYLGRFSQP
ncbi:MAG: cytochrome c [Bdellovibrionales bacterium]|nr:cytochrome c [Bdellovibrionales bacterium]